VNEADGRFAGDRGCGDIHEPMASDPSGKSVRGLLFGSVAECYERYRLDYPNELVDTVLRYAGRPVRTALEVGAGTGKATRLFASRGIEVTALEPDADMAHVLDRATRGLPVRPVVSTFEEFRIESRFDLVYAAAAWHWTSPVARWARAVELLAPGGVLVLFGRPAELKDPDLFAAVEEIEKRVLLGDDPVEVHPWSIEEMAAADGLADVEQRDLPCVATTTAEEFVGRLATVSAYLKLSPEQRAGALRQVRAILPDQVDIDATVQLSLARRVDQSVS
jgi:SAM-dependent methyltransferase